MTREEELDWLYRLRSEIYVYMPKEWLIPMNNALDMAIKALEQEPSGDAISRQAVLERLKKEDKILYTTTGLNYLIRAIGELPSVNPQEPKTGEWQQDLDGTYLCSECGSGFKEQPTLMGKPMFLWCPLCGCRMVEPQESEDKCKNCEYYHNPDYTRCHKCKAESEDKE